MAGTVSGPSGSVSGTQTGEGGNPPTFTTESAPGGGTGGGGGTTPFSSSSIDPDFTGAKLRTGWGPLAMPYTAYEKGGGIACKMWAK